MGIDEQEWRLDRNESCFLWNSSWEMVHFRSQRSSPEPINGMELNGINIISIIYIYIYVYIYICVI